jgi:hypothetical protein
MVERQLEHSEQKYQEAKNETLEDPNLYQKKVTLSVSPLLYEFHQGCLLWYHKLLETLPAKCLPNHVNELK